MAPAFTSATDDDDLETRTAFQKSLDDFKLKCSAQSLQRFANVTSLEVKVEILRIQRDQERLKAMINFRRIQAFILRLEEFNKILQGFVDGPYYLSYIWGVMKFLLQTAASTLLEGLDGLLDAYERVGSKIPSLKDISGVFTKHSGMRKCMIALYQDILAFHSGAYQCFTQFPERGRKRVFKSAWKDFNHQIKFIEDNIQAHGVLIDLGRRLLGIHSESTGSVQKDCHLSADYQRELSVNVARYEAESISRARAAQEAETKRHQKQFQDTLQWICAAPNTFEDTHSDRCEVRRKYPETCNWILKNDSVDNWLNEITPMNSILWINGSMGAGKTTLASHIVDKCIGGTSVTAPFKTIYFYCKAKEPESSTCLAIFRGLLYQQLMHVREIWKYRHLLAYCQDKKDAAGRQHIETEEVAKSLLDLFFDVFPHQYIIVDGLDECDNQGIKQCLSLLTSVVARQDGTEPGGLRLLVVSRDIPDIRKPLSAGSTTAKIVEIQATDNEDAIEKYVTQRLTEFPHQLKLSKDETENIKDLICKNSRGAQGMFLFAELVLNNLQRADSKAWLMKELKVHQFPRNLAQAYERIIANIKAHRDGEQWEKTKSILGWLICAKRPLRWHEIQGIVSIELRDQSVEFYQNRFITDAEELCGSLVRVKPGNKVELIHHTARDFIIKSKFVNEVEVEFELALLCMQYLTFPCFARGLSPRQRRIFAERGFYAFQDYAVSLWFHHIATLVKISGRLLDVDVSKAEKFARILDNFTYRYQESIHDRILAEDQDPSQSLKAEDDLRMKEVEEHARKECENLRNAAFHPMLLNLWVHISKHQKGNIEERNKVSLKEMEITLTENRKIIEGLMTDDRGKDAKSLEEKYGSKVFKCPRTRCDFFYEGFEDAKAREHHINRHDRPFECTVRDCNVGGAGFISGKDLERHKKNYHMDAGDTGEQPGAFPQLSKKSNDAKFPCEICGQRFTRKINQVGHMRSHFGERPFGCQNCGKRFTRVNDLRRHERLHLRN